MEKIETVSFDLINSIYRHINRTENLAALLSNRQKWDRLTSALKVLEDTSWAIEYYLENKYPMEVKGKYLYTYGLLQALFVQGDAINSISIALFGKKINFREDYPKAFEIREMRNDVTGHPTQRGTSNYIFLAQCSLEKGSFHYSRNNSDSGQFDTIVVDVCAAISETANCINTILESAIDELEAEFIKYIDQHRGRKMKKIFNLLHTYKEEALLDSMMGTCGYESTKNLVKQCEDELVLRYGSVDVMDSYRYLLQEIHDIFSLIDNGIPQIPYNLQRQFKKYMLQILFAKLEELQCYCEETDEYFKYYGREDEPSQGIP